MGLLTAIFGNYSEKEIKRIRPLVDKVLSYEEQYRALSDEQLRAKTDEFIKPPLLFQCFSFC
jgi:preprotein translocase subunit SecA